MMGKKKRKEIAWWNKESPNWFLPVAFITLIFSVLLYGASLDKIEFKITKEVCEECVKNSAQINCPASENVNYSQFYFNDQFVPFLCAIVESERLKYNQTFYDWRICMHGDNYSIGRCFPEDILCKKVEVDIIELGEGWYQIKENIDFEWLDEYCEATKFTKCEDLDCKNQEIYEYKCGKYFVEVLK